MWCIMVWYICGVSWWCVCGVYHGVVCVMYQGVGCPGVACMWCIKWDICVWHVCGISCGTSLCGMYVVYHGVWWAYCVHDA